MIDCGCVEGSCESASIHNDKVLGLALEAYSKVNWEAVSICLAAGFLIQELSRIGIKFNKDEVSMGVVK